jgi:hypothetical protein
VACDNLTLNDPNIKLSGSQVNVCVQTDTNGATSIMALQRCENPKIFIAWPDAYCVYCHNTVTILSLRLMMDGNHYETNMYKVSPPSEMSKI